MMQLFSPSPHHPLPHSTLIAALAAVIVVLALLVGWYSSRLQLEQRRYLRLEDRYVRVRSELGRDETQRLIDESYQE
ncbi:MAG: hypothetical protein COU69_04770 [Candidatus Pacebacteria bacterium CG10_big_fil_rev_8_21_14_0_10_56_10]|nr:MAG: hypothetical protein COU69_04770 [Candidatus Pacebacteria bacterium CG10_big_fil_rev_8_21_14_0_10_56_10]